MSKTVLKRETQIISINLYIEDIKQWYTDKIKKH